MTYCKNEICSYEEIEKASQVRLGLYRDELNEELRRKEDDQTYFRSKLQTALRKKRIKDIQEYSQIIRMNRRMPDGLRDLNRKIIYVYSLIR